MNSAHTRLFVAILLAPCAGPIAAEEMLAKTSGCLECHGAAQKGVAPSFRDIAARYRGNPRARIELLETVKRGGKGNWAEASSGALMPPYSPRLSDVDIQRLVDWVLAQ